VVFPSCDALLDALLLVPNARRQPLPEAEAQRKL
jgi:hypothetical protein